MVRYGFALVRVRDGTVRALVLLEPQDDVADGQLARRLEAAGLKPTHALDWYRLELPCTTCSVTVEDGLMTQVNTGRARLLCHPPEKVSEHWVAAAATRSAVLGLVSAPARPALRCLVQPDRVQLAGFAAVLDTPAPMDRSATRVPRIGVRR